MKSLAKVIFVLLLCFMFGSYGYAQDESVAIELNSPLSFEVTSSEDPGSEFFFTYEGKEGEHLVIYIVPENIHFNEMRGTLEIRRSDGSNIGRSIVLMESIWYLPADDTYTIYVASTTPDTFEITISNPVELTLGEVYEGTITSELNQAYIVRTEERLGIRMHYNNVEGSPGLQIVSISGLYMGYSEGYVAIAPTNFESIELRLEQSETPFYLIQLSIGGIPQEEYETSTFTLEAFTPED